MVEVLEWWPCECVSGTRRLTRVCWARFANLAFLAVSESASEAAEAIDHEKAQNDE